MTEKTLFDLSTVLLTASLCQLAVFLLYLITDRKGNRRLNAGLSLVLAITAIPYLSVFFFVRGPILPLIPFAHIGSVVGFLSGPVLYLYLREYLTGRRPALKSDRIHLLLFALVLVPFVRFAVIESGNYSAGYADIRLIIAFVPYAVLYSVLSVMLILNNRAPQAQAQHRSVRWSVFLFTGTVAVQFFCGMIFLLWVIIPVFDHGFWTSRLYFLMKPYSLILYFTVFIVFVNVMSYFCFRGIQINGHLERYRHSRLKAGEKENYRGQIEAWMQTGKPYLNPLLSLENMASSLGIPSKDLSQILNECFSANFANFINTYRIREALRIIDERSGGRTILDISFESGFNAKSTFNMVFKKQIGMSPREYIRNKSEAGTRLREADRRAAEQRHAYGNTSV